MKNLMNIKVILNLISIAIMLVSPTIIVAQFDYGQECGVDQSTSSQVSTDDLTYTFDSSCDPLPLGIRFVFLTRGDGFGSFDPNSSMINQWVNQGNFAWQNINDPQSCEQSLNYPLGANVQIILKGVHTIQNSNAWNYRKAAQNITYYKTAFCPSGIESGNWPALKAEIDQFNNQYPGTINIFFVENGDHLNYLKFHIDNGIPLTEPWPHYRDTPIFSGCSRLPGSYNSDRNTYIIEANFFTEYYLRLNFGHIYYPDQNVPNSTLASWVVYAMGYHLNHELGHSILNQFHSPCGCLNLMQGGSCGYKPTKNHLNANQFTELHKTLSTSSNKKYIDCNDMKDSHCDILVEKDVTINSPLSVYGDIIIKSGNTLTVKSEIFLSDYSRIVVEENGKLIVDGGKLTSLCNLWDGVKVFGGNSDFDVKFTNNSIIENTQDAAVSMFAPEPWPEITQWGNGILKAENTTFNNTNRIVEFISWSPLPNSSYIKNCVQNGGRVSITNWNCQGIVVKDNVFNTRDYCIVTEVGSFVISGNEFNSGGIDILINNVSAGISTKVMSNEFNGTTIGYNARGTTFAQNEIWDNNFQTGYIDVMNDGQNHYDLRGNDFTSVFGSVSFNNGTGIADVHNNNFSGNLIGVLTMGNNNDFNFFENCYSTSYIDNYIDGSVSPIVHKNSGPANNCFTHAGNQLSNVQDLGGIPSPFTYLEPQDAIIDCRDAILAHPNVNRVQNGFSTILPECGTNIEGGNDYNWNHCWPDREIKSEVITAYNWLNSKIREIGNDTDLTINQKARLNQIYTKCFRRVKGYLSEIYLAEENYSSARSLYTGINNDDAKVFIYSTYIMEDDLNSARTYLNSIVSGSEEMNDFITIQNINLDRLPYGPFYQVTDSVVNTIENIALKNHSYAGFAKALYYVLTGEVISSDIPDVLINMAESRREFKKLNQLEELKIYPNPFSDNLFIETNGNDDFQIEVFNVKGEQIHNPSQIVNSRISTSSWDPGFYIINIIIKGEVVLSKKMILTR